MTLEEIDQANEINGQTEDQTEATRRDTIQDVLVDLAYFLKDASPAEAPGLRAAIEIIRENYPH